MLHNMLRAAAGAGGNLLDDYPGAVGAYSIRLLSSGYVGSCMRVKRSSDSAEQDIGFVSGDLDTSALLAFTGASDGRVVTWYDQSGNANHTSAVPAAEQPFVVVAGSLYTDSGLPAVRAAGVDTDGIPTGITNLINKTLVVVGNSSDFSSNQATRRFTTSYSGAESVDNDMILDYYKPSSVFRYFDGGLSVAAASALGRHMIFAYRNASEIGIHIDGSAGVTSASPNANPNPRQIKLYEDGGGELSAREIPQSISEVIVYSSDLSADRASIESNINDYYGVY